MIINQIYVDAKSGKRKSFPLSLAPGRTSEIGQGQSQEKFFWLDGRADGGWRMTDKKRSKNFVLGSPESTPKRIFTEVLFS